MGRQGVDGLCQASVLQPINPRTTPPILCPPLCRCWDHKSTCPSRLIESVTYTEISGTAPLHPQVDRGGEGPRVGSGVLVRVPHVVAGVIGGMLIIGALADVIGRRRGSFLTSAIMFIGSILLVSSTSSEYGVAEGVGCGDSGEGWARGPGLAFGTAIMA